MCAKLASLKAGYCGFHGLGHIADTETEIGDFVAVDANFLLRRPGLAADLDIRDAGHGSHGLLDTVCQCSEGVESKAADFHREPLSTAQNPGQKKLTLRSTRADEHARDLAGQVPPEISRDVEIGPRALACRHE